MDIPREVFEGAAHGLDRGRRVDGAIGVADGGDRAKDVAGYSVQRMQCSAASE